MITPLRRRETEHTACLPIAIRTLEGLFKVGPLWAGRAVTTALRGRVCRFVSDLRKPPRTAN